MAELKFSKDHEWVRLEGGVATIGITDHAQTALGDFVGVFQAGKYELDEIGEPATPGSVNSAAVIFHWQEVMGGTNAPGVASAWTSHFGLDLGKH